MTRGKVCLVPFPFDDLSVAKARPAVCLTNPIGPHRHVILAYISSRIFSEAMETDLVLDANQADFAGTGLRVSSAVRLHRLLMTVTSAFIQRELGELSSRMQAEVSGTYLKIGFAYQFRHARESGHLERLENPGFPPARE